MPTVAIYVPMNIARRVAARWDTQVENGEFAELVRGICSAALEEEGQFEFFQITQDPDCRWAKFHVAQRRCRHCGGS